MPSRTRLTCTALLISCAASAAAAQRPTIPDSIGVILVAHGADAAWNARVDSLASAVRRGGQVRGPIAVSYLMGPGARLTRFQDAVATVARAGARRAVVVPILISTHSGHFEQVRYLAGETDSLDQAMMHHLHEAGLERAAGPFPLRVTPALDGSTELAEVVAARALAIAPEPAGRALFLFGHGPNSAEDYAAWMSNLRQVADAVKRVTRFASVAVELVRDDAPPAVRAEAVLRAREIVELQRAATGRDVVVVPLLISAGSLANRTMPADLSGLAIAYAGDPVLPHDAIVRWVERRVREATQRP